MKEWLLKFDDTNIIDNDINFSLEKTVKNYFILNSEQLENVGNRTPAVKIVKVFQRCGPRFRFFDGVSAESFQPHLVLFP